MAYTRKEIIYYSQNEILENYSLFVDLVHDKRIIILTTGRVEI